MPATCVRTTRPATADELATLRESGKARGTLGCLAVPAVFVVGGAVAVGVQVGWVVGTAVVLVAAVGAGAVVVSFLNYWRPVRDRIRQDVATATVEVLTITSAAPLEIPATHSSVDPAFAIELDGNRTLLLLGQYLCEPATFGGTYDRSGDADAGDAFANALPPPLAFPTSAFTVHRFPVSGEVVRIDLAGEYVAPAELGGLDLRAVNEYPSRVFDVVPSELVDVLPKTP